MKWVWVLAVLAVGCAPRAALVTVDDAWAAAQVQPQDCDPWNPDGCWALTDMPPESLRAALNAPAWSPSGAELVSVVDGVRLVMNEQGVGMWGLIVVPPQGGE